MGKRLAFSLIMLAAGAVLLTAAALAGPSRGGGIFKVAEVGPGFTMDPQVASWTTIWGIESATAAKLFNFPDSSSRRIVPEVASGYTISKDGRTYSFPIRKGYRFSDGTPVTAKSFAYAFRRIESSVLQSPAEQLIRDREGLFVTSYGAKGNRFVVHLLHPRAEFMSLLTMPYFQATSRKLPLDHEVVTVSSPKQLPTAGPYMLTYNDPNTRTAIRRNPYYRGARPRRVKGVTLYWNQTEQQAYLGTLRGKFDETLVTPDDVCHRVNCHPQHFQVRPLPCTGYIALNTRHGVFKDVQMRKAFNWVVSRRDYAAQAGLGGSPWSDLLPPNFPGSMVKKTSQPWPDVPRIAKARKLAAGHFGDGKITVVWRSSGTIGPAQKQIVNRDLLRLGFQEQNIKWISFPGSDIGPPPWETNFWDMVISLGWCQEYVDSYYADPYDFFQLFLLPAREFPTHIDNSMWRKRIRAAARLTGSARLRAFGRLDLRMMKDYAPIAVMRTYNTVYAFSARVDRGSLLFSGVYSDWDYGLIGFK